MNLTRPVISVSDRIGSRAQRRNWVIALYAGFAAGCIVYSIAAQFGDRSMRAAGLVVVLMSFGVTAWGFWKLMRRTLINAPNISDADLDERYRERGRDATRRAYMTLGMLTAVVPLYVEIATTAERWTWMRNSTLIADLAWGLFLLALTLPTAIMAWTEPDPIADP